MKAFIKELDGQTFTFNDKFVDSRFPGNSNTELFDSFKTFDCWEKLFSTKDFEFDGLYIDPKYYDIFYRIKELYNRHTEAPTVVFFPEEDFKGEPDYYFPTSTSNILKDFIPKKQYKSVINKGCALYLMDNNISNLIFVPIGAHKNIFNIKTSPIFNNNEKYYGRVYYEAITDDTPNIGLGANFKKSIN